MQPNCVQVLGADIFFQVLETASFPTSKEFTVPEVTIVKQRWMQAYMQPN